MTKPTQSIIHVNAQAQLDALCQKWLALPMLAVDTEFMRTNTYYPLPALLQINDGGANYLIDPLAIEDFSSLKSVMLAPDVKKVLHACSEDLEVFNRLFSVLPNNLFDTQIAIAFLGLGFSMGYGNMVEALLNIQLPKGETRSDWLQRPLTESQEYYAAMDVEHLYVIATTVLEQLESKGRLHWVEEECQALLQGFVEGQKPENAVQRFRAAWRLNERQLATLDALARWRDLTAQERDVPRSYVLKDKSVFGIAETLPTHVGQLRKIEELQEKSIRRYGETVVAIVAQVAQLQDALLPPRLVKPPTSKQQNTIKLLREKITEVADGLDIAPEYLARKKDYEFILRAAADGATGESLLPESLASWRADLIKPVLTQYL